MEAALRWPPALGPSSPQVVRCVSLSSEWVGLVLYHLILPKILQDRHYYYPHHMNEEADLEKELNGGA